MKQVLFFLVALCLSCAPSRAQTFQWVKGGGSIYSSQYLSDGEQVAAMCADSNRNIYALSVIYTQNLTADTFHVNQGHYPYIRSMLLTSYRCDGTMRWSRLFEGAGDSYTGGLAYDGGGNIYFSGDLNGLGYPKYFASNTANTAHDNQSTFTAKMDTSGNLSWIQFATPNVQAAVYKSFAQGLAIDGQGAVHNYAYVKTGVQLSSTVTSQKGLYDFKYDATGTLLGITRLNIDSAYVYMLTPVIMKGSNKLIAEVYQDYTTGTTHYLGAFTPSGNLVWKDTLNYASYFTGVAYDGANGIYGAGLANADDFVIANQTLTNTLSPGTDMSVVLKLDTSGNIKWTYTVEHSIIGRLYCLALLPGGKLIAGGYTGATTRHGSTTFIIPPNQGVPYYTTLDTSGAMIALSYLHTDQLFNFFTAAAADKSGNAYLGGIIEDTVLLPGGAYYQSRGGNSDFFIAKYGYGCNCAAAPIANFSSSLTVARTVQFTYTGTATGIDSLVWNFGDGQKQKVTSGYTTPITHTYAIAGAYNTCATVYNSCGMNPYCKSIAITAATGVTSLTGLDNIAVNPNPASSHLHVEGAAGATGTLINSIGQRAIQFGINQKQQEIDISGLPAGMYILQLTDANGNRRAISLLKQ